MSDELLKSTFASPELAIVGQFLQQQLPFIYLSESELHRTVHKLVVSYHRQGERITRATPDSGLRVLRSGAVELRDGDNKLLDRLGEGESFHIGGLNAEQVDVRATVIEDALLYLLPDAQYQQLRAGNRQFDRYFTSQRSKRLRRAARYEPAPNAMLRQVAALMNTQLLTVQAEDSVEQVARAMAQHRFSSALIVDAEQLLGIVTDRDIRVRYAAQALPPQVPVRDIMTPDPTCIQGTDTVFSAILLMTRCGYHHLPVLVEGQLCGMLTTSDLMLARQDDPVYLVQHISRQTTVQGIKELAAGLSNLLLQWVNAGIRASQISRILTAVSDAITVRLIQLAEQELGPAPVAWCWLGFGSQARSEQLLGADQDNGLVISDAMQPDHRPWFTALAARVCDGLNACGYVYCPGDIMASTEQWCQPLATWQQNVRRWTETPTPEAVMQVSIFFDLRAVHGDASLCKDLQKVMLHQASSNTIFLAHLAANALASRAPLGIFRRFLVERDGEHRDSLDLKKRGVLPLTELVRLHALANQIEAVNTDERLQALAAAKHMTLTDSRNLADALHFIQRQRLEHQAEKIAQGMATSNFLKPGNLPKLAREQLRDAFAIIDGAQAAVKLDYRQGMA